MSLKWSEAFPKEGAFIRRRARRAASIVLVGVLLSVVLTLSGCTGEEDEIPPGPTVATDIDLTTLSPGGSSQAFYIDLVNGKPWKTGEVHTVAADGKDITVNGWSVDIKSRKAAAGMFVNVDGKNDIPISYGEERRDVADYLKSQDFLMTGFTAAVPTANLAKGRHTINFKIVSADRREYFVPIYKVEIDLK